MTDLTPLKPLNTPSQVLFAIQPAYLSRCLYPYDDQGLEQIYGGMLLGDDEANRSMRGIAVSLTIGNVLNMLRLSARMRQEEDLDSQLAAQGEVLMAEDQIRKLEGRIKELENELKQMRGSREVADISAEEIQTYLKVRDLVAWDPDFACGINECARCIVTRCYVACIRCIRCIQVCDVECTCGPCSQGGFLGGGGRFGGLGG